MLLVFALAAGVAYGYFGVPIFLAMSPGDDTASVVEEHRLSDDEDLRFRVQLLRTGMDHGQVERVLGRHTEEWFFRTGGFHGKTYVINQYTLCCYYSCDKLVMAELRNAQLQLVVRVPLENSSSQ